MLLRGVKGEFFVALGTNPRWRGPAVLVVAGSAAAGALVAIALAWPTPIVGAAIAFPAVLFALSRLRPVLLVRPEPPAAIHRSLCGPFWSSAAVSPSTVIRTTGGDLEICEAGDSAPLRLRASHYPLLDLTRLGSALQLLARADAGAAEALSTAGFASGVGEKALREFSLQNRDWFLYVLIAVMVVVLVGMDALVEAVG